MPKIAFRWILSVFFILAGLNHFREPATYIEMMPSWLPWAIGLNAIAGACEALGGIGLLLPPFRRAAGWGLISLLIAVFPVNVHAALEGHMPGFDVSPALLWLRLPFQGVFIAWVAWVAFDRVPSDPTVSR